MPQDNKEGIALGLSTKGDDDLNIEESRWLTAAGPFQGSHFEGVIRPPLAKLVSSPTPSSASNTVR